MNHTHCNTNREHFLSANSQKLTNKQTTSKTITSTCWFMVHFTSTKRRKQRILFSNNRVDFPSAVSVLCFCLITWRVASATTPLTYRPLNRFKTEQQQEKHSTFHCQWMRESNKLSSAGEENRTEEATKFLLLQLHSNSASDTDSTNGQPAAAAATGKRGAHQFYTFSL